MPVAWAPEHSLIVVPRADHATLGLLSSTLHVVWAAAVGGRLGIGNAPRYNSTRCFEAFPFPAGLTPTNTAHQRTEPIEDGTLIPAGLPTGIRKHATAIAGAARRLADMQDAWLNPPEWTERVPEVVPPGMKKSRKRAKRDVLFGA